MMLKIIDALRALIATASRVGPTAVAVLALLVALSVIWRYGGSG
jgi:hypothetical protein